MVVSAKNTIICDHFTKEDFGLCSVCIATYRRPHLLKKLLESLEKQILPEGFPLEIIVVDNDTKKTAAPIVKKFIDKSTMRILYFNQPEKNISITRNMAVNKATGRYLLFIDDDESASPKWIYHLLNTLIVFKCDGVFGPVVPEFNKDTPKWMKRSDLFYSPITATGTKATYKWTSNCIVIAKLLKKVKGPFERSYGITGGEDSHLFDLLEREGAKFVYCQEAWVSEFLPPDRTRLSYLFLRGMKGGNTHTRRAIEFSGNKHLMIRLLMISKALTYGSISITLICLFFFDTVRRTKWLIRLASNIGRFLAAFGLHYKNY